MNVKAINAEIGRRVTPLVEHIYVRLPAQPVFPCAVVGFPVVDEFHVTSAHHLTRSRIELQMIAGRGDSDDAIARCEQWVSTDTPESVLRAVEARNDAAAPDPLPWQRVKVASSSDLRTIGDAVVVTFTIEIDA